VILLERASAVLGRIAVEALMRRQRAKLGVRVRHHRDDKGRVTPVLRLGQARRGRLVFLHGFGDRADTFLGTAAKLAEDFEVTIPAMPGFGEGWVDRSEVHTSSAFADWIGDVLEDEVDGRFHLMGNSLGGLTSLRLALRVPSRIESLIVVSPAGVALPDVRSMHDDAADGKNPFFVRNRDEYDPFVRLVFARPAKLPRPVADYLYREHLEGRIWFEKLMADRESEVDVRDAPRPFSAVPLEDIAVPTTVVWGERDGIFPAAHGRFIAERIPGARFELLEGIGHCPHIERPSKLAEVFRRHVDAI
jgi:pimeloyl-ACP methyl ester carboxylesterase